MGTINEKLSYLSKTKTFFKDNLNSLGAEITNSTTFRNYLNWLDIFYNNVSNKTDLSINGIAGRTSQNTVILPSEYTQVDYIESSGTQYIDTGVNADTNLRVVLDIAYTSPSSSNQNIGSIHLQSGNTKRYHLLPGDKDGRKILLYLNDAYTSLADADTNRHYIDINVPIGQATYDNNTITIPTNIADTELNFYLFGRNSTSTIYLSKVKQWTCQMYYENILIRDFIPCYRNSDNEVGLYDIINDIFYTNQGTGAFTYGSVVSIPNPDYPQPINNLSGNVPYKVGGKNLFDKNNITTGYRLNQNGGGMIDDDYYISSYIKVKPDTIYTKNSPQADAYHRFAFYTDTDYNTTIGISSDNTITTPSNCQYLRFCGLQSELNETQLEENSTATDFKPYIEPQIFNIPLGDIELCKIDTYEDRIYSSDGRFYLYKNIIKKTIDGNSTPYGISSDATPTPRTVCRVDLSNIFINTMYYSNRFIPNSQTANRYVPVINNQSPYMSLDNTITGINVSDTNEQKIAKFKEYFSSNNIIVYYPTTPTITEITSSNYPELYNVLKQIQDYLTAYKINKEFILNYDEPNINY